MREPLHLRADTARPGGVSSPAPSIPRLAAAGGMRAWARRCGSVVTFYLALAGPLAAMQPARHGYHPIMPGQRLLFRCRLDTSHGPEMVEAPLKVRAANAPSKMSQQVALPAPWPAFRLVEYLPAAVLEQDVVADAGDDAQVAVKLAIEGPTQSLSRWLIANDHARNRLTSFIATWRLMAVQTRDERDELLRQFRHELTRQPMLRVAGADGRAVERIPLELGVPRHLGELGCTVVARRFFPHYARDNAASEPVNLSAKRVNPAALLELRRGDRTETRWVFAKFPTFKHEGQRRLPFDVSLDCPVVPERALPDFAVVVVGRDVLEVWSRYDGNTTARRIEAGEPTDISASPYRFHIARFEPSGRLVETYRPADKGVPALAVRYRDASGEEAALWLPLGTYRAVTTPAGIATIGFDRRDAGGLGAHP